MPHPNCSADTSISWHTWASAGPSAVSTPPRPSQKFSALEWTHSAIYNPTLVVNTDGTNYITCGVTNTVWERGAGEFGLSVSSSNSTVS